MNEQQEIAVEEFFIWYYNNNQRHWLSSNETIVDGTRKRTEKKQKNPEGEPNGDGEGGGGGWGKIKFIFISVPEWIFSPFWLMCPHIAQSAPIFTNKDEDPPKARLAHQLCHARVLSAEFCFSRHPPSLISIDRHAAWLMPRTLSI